MPWLQSKPDDRHDTRHECHECDVDSFSSVSAVLGCVPGEKQLGTHGDSVRW